MPVLGTYTGARSPPPHVRRPFPPSIGLIFFFAFAFAFAFDGYTAKRQ